MNCNCANGAHTYLLALAFSFIPNYCNIIVELCCLLSLLSNKLNFNSLVSVDECDVLGVGPE